MMPDPALLFHGAVLLILFGGLAAVLLNLACFDGLTPARPLAGAAPRVSILVPARNEESCIGPCVRSLLAQEYPNFELIVLDDQSSDATPQLLDELGLKMGDTRHRTIRGSPLPAGWVGKNWACDQLARAATGDFLFFTDADTVHEPGTVSAAVAYAERRNASLVSAWPRLVTVSWGERTTIPMILLVGMTLYAHWLVLLLQRWPAATLWMPAWARRGLGAANGQFMFWRRAAYEQVGGHAGLRDHLVEDVALGRAVTARIHEGMRLYNCDALRFSRCRMYRNLGEVWEGFTKNLWPAFESRHVLFFAYGLVHSAAYLVPCVLLFTSWQSLWRPCILLEVVMIFLIRTILTLRFRTSWWSVLLHPLAEVLSLSIGLNSWRRAGRGGVLWKGRRYLAADAG